MDDGCGWAGRCDEVLDTGASSARSTDRTHDSSLNEDWFHGTTLQAGLKNNAEVHAMLTRSVSADPASVDTGGKRCSG
jgi:hypothetical protein